MNAPLQFALIGCGVVGRKRAAALRPGQLRYACDIDGSRAAELARKSDIAILFLGTNLQVEAEGRDRRELNLPGAQQQLMEAVFATSKIWNTRVRERLRTSIMRSCLPRQRRVRRRV